MLQRIRESIVGHGYDEDANLGGPDKFAMILWQDCARDSASHDPLDWSLISGQLELREDVL